MHFRFARRPREASALVGALALAVIIAVAASLALGGALHKVKEAESKEANVEAWLALDSTAATILSYLDQTLRTKEGLTFTAGDLTTAIGSTAVISSGDYSVNVAQDVQVLGPNSISLRSMVGQASNGTTDPLLEDHLSIGMVKNSLEVSIAAQPQRADLPVFTNYYKIQIRAIPVTNWAAFNPGVHHDQITLQGTSPRAYVGITEGGGVIPSNGVDGIQKPYQRLWRTDAGAKFPNAATIALSSFGMSATGNLEQWGQLYDPFDANTGDDLYSGMVDGLTGKLCNEITAYAGMELAANNPFSESTIGLLDLGNYVADYLSNSSGTPDTLCIPPPISSGGSLLHTIVVTNADQIPAAELNVTFPTGIKVFFAGAVNTNRTTKLKIEGNIGFLPTNIWDIINSTNYAGKGRTFPVPAACTQVYSNNVQYTSSELTLNASEDAFENNPQILKDLFEWARQEQIALLSSGDCKIDGIDQENYLLDLLKALPITDSVSPNVSTITDTKTNLFSTIVTNQLVSYNYAGYAVPLDVCGSQALERTLYALDLSSPDEHLAGALPVQGLFDLLVEVPGTTNTVPTIEKPFDSDEIRVQDGLLLPALTGNYSISATLKEWTPVNKPMDAWFPPVTADNINQLPFAVAWITINQGYIESYKEDYQVYQSPGYSTTLEDHPADTYSRVAEDEIKIPGLGWKQYLWDAWHNGLAGFGTEPGVADGPTKDRYTNPLGSPEVWSPDNEGAWRKTSYTVIQGGNTEPSDTLTRYGNITDRTVTFNYRTLGWTKTNVVEQQNEAPPFYGRLVVEDGIKRLEGFNFGGTFKIDGQVTYSHREKPSGGVTGGEMKISSYTIVYDPDVLPAGRDCIIDVRIAESRLGTR